MSVRMALAKLCACTCGGAIVGGGAVHVADVTQTRHVYAQKVTKRVVRRTTVARQGSKIRRVVTQTRAACPPAVVTVTSQGAPIPLPPAFAGSGGEVSGGGGGAAAVVGGSGGFGGG